MTRIHLISIRSISQMISEVKKMAYDFAIEVCEDVSRMVEAFGKGTAPDELVLQRWNDLKDMRSVLLPELIIILISYLRRNLVNEICRWAYELVVRRDSLSPSLSLRDILRRRLSH